jgi:ubiquinone/menaquinone biosynthesis C-methylase UbiE
MPGPSAPTPEVDLGSAGGRLNDVEMRGMRGWLRRMTQRHLELPALFGMLEAEGIDLEGARLLDAGCGAGDSTRSLALRFHPSRLVAIDLMPEMVALARTVAPAAEVKVGDVSALAEPDGAFDAVFVLGVLHHVPGWKLALRELARVLAPGGVLLLEELRGRAVDLEDRFVGTRHPKEARFEWPELRRAIVDAGFEILRDRAVACCTPIRWPPDGARAFLCRKAD